MGKKYIPSSVYNRWIDKLRRRKTRLARLVVLSEQHKFHVSNSHSGDRLNVVLDLQSALDKLDDEQRAAILLICVEGYSYAEAATVLVFFIRFSAWPQASC